MQRRLAPPWTGRTIWLLGTVLVVAALLAGPSAPALATFQGSYLFTSETGVANDYVVTDSDNPVSFTDTDDGNQTVPAFDIGFPFQLDGASYTRFSVNTNGLLKLGEDDTVVSPSSFNDPFPTDTSGISDTDYPFISAAWDDLVVGSLTGSVSYKLFGTAPNRVLVVRWLARRHNNSSSSLVDQVRLYETVNVVELYYESRSLGTTPLFSSFIGLVVSPTNFERIVPGTPPTVSFSGTGTAVPPAAGTLYRLGPPNQAPAVTVPSTPTVPDGKDRPITGLSLTDADAGQIPLQVQLSVSHGTISLPTQTGLSFTVGDGTADATMTVTGTLTALNSALATLTYRSDADYQGADSLQIAVDDQATTSIDGAKTGSASLSITVNGHPHVSADSYTAPPNGTLTVDAANGVLKNDTRLDPSPSATKLSNPAHGALTFNADGSFSYTAAAGYTGPDSFTYKVSDGVSDSGVATVSLNVSGPIISIQDVAVPEGKASTTPARFPVQLSAATSYPVSVQWATTDDSAKAGADYLAASGTLTFAPNQTEGLISVTVLSDTLAEPDESFTVTITNPANATIARAAGSGTIVDDDSSATLPPSGSAPPQACVPRPNVTTYPTTSGGKVQVHVEATPLNTQQNNPLRSIRFGVLQNAKVTLNGQPVTDGQTYEPPPSTVAVDFTMERARQGEATTVPFTVVDGCGEWQTFVGGGTSAGF